MGSDLYFETRPFVMTSIRRLLRFIVIGLAAVGAPACSGARTDVEGVAEAERARFSALMEQDLASLEPLLDPALFYCHSNAECESRAEFLATVQSGRIRYTRIEVLELEPRLLARDVAVVHGRLALDGEIAGQPASMQLSFTDVHRFVDGRWRLVAWQSTRVPPVQSTP
jgi:ketosteroid isomerase-like protein